MKKNPADSFRGVIPRSKRARRLLGVLAASCLLGVIVGNISVPQGGSDALASAEFTPAETASTIPADALAPSLTGVWTALGVFVLLAVIVVVLTRNGRRFGPGNGSIHVVDTIPLGGRRLIHLIRCGDRKYLIGNSERGLSYLASVPPEAAERDVDFRFDQEDDDAQPGELPFANVLAGSGRGR